MKMKKRTLFILIAIALFCANAIAWAISSQTLQINITPAGNFQDGTHGLAKVVPLSGNVSITQGKAQKISGVELFRIDLGSASFSDQIQIHLSLMNPADMGKILQNRNSFILASVWYKDAGGTLTLNDGATKVSQDPNAQTIMSQVSGDVVLMPTTPGQTTLYVLASIVVPGGAPPGSQSLDTLRFYCDVR